MKFEENVFKNIKETVEKKVEKAVANYFTVGQNLEQDLTDDALRGEIFSKLENATIKVNTLNEFRLALEKLKNLRIFKDFGEKQINELISHENAHANKAEELGAEHKSFKIVIIKNNENDYALSTTTAEIYIPEEWDAKKKREVLVQIFKAPEIYGGSNMSSYDKKMLLEILYEEREALLKEREVLLKEIKDRQKDNEIIKSNEN
ncbi:MAG: hypothetical protein WC908_00200 [Candidatus Paceibacterota bacterium]